MQYSNGTDSIVDDARYWSGTNATTYPIADLTRNANQGVARVDSLIKRFDNTWEYDDSNNSDLPIATTALVASQQDYSLAVTHQKILRVRIKDQNGNWITLRPVSRREKTDSELAATGTPAEYDKLGTSVFLYPMPNYSQAASLEVQYQRETGYFTTADTTKTPGWASQFHRLVSLYAALDYCEAKGLKDRAVLIRDRIGSPPSDDGRIPGKGLEGELATFYSSRDYDRPHALTLQSESYGPPPSEGDNPKAFIF